MRLESDKMGYNELQTSIEELQEDNATLREELAGAVHSLSVMTTERNDFKGQLTYAEAAIRSVREHEHCNVSSDADCGKWPISFIGYFKNEVVMLKKMIRSSRHQGHRCAASTPEMVGYWEKYHGKE
jgi:FtsZ-binding cell division protein ZapB